MKPNLRLLSIAVLACGLLALPGAAQAQTPTFVAIDGDPLDVLLGNTGRIQARFPDTTGGQFFPPGSDEANAGFLLGVDLADPNTSPTLLGFNGTNFTAGGQNPVTGTGSQQDPFRQVSTFTGTAPTASQPITVVQTATYVNGTGSFNLRWDITNGGSTPTVVRPMLAADLYAGGSDSGTGFLEQNPRAIGGLSSVGAGTGAIVEVSPWAGFQEDHYGTVFGRASDLRSPAEGGGFQNSFIPTSLDYGLGVQGPDVAICQGCPSGATTTFESALRFVNFLSLDPGQTSSAVGTEQAINVRLINQDGSPRGGVPIVYSIFGANTGQGSVPTGADGTARIAYRGQNAGTDTMTVFPDFNRNGTQDFDSEPQRQATIEWLAPVAGSTGVGEVVSGTVLVRLPRGASPSRYGLREEARQAQSGFIPLARERATSLPVGTTINANRGRMSLSSASNLTGGTQSAQFYSGTFQFRQRRTSRPITEINLKGGSFSRCRRGKSSSAEAVASRSRGRRIRRVWGNGRGRFRTRGRYSSATVRGTTWLTEDRCNGTLTSVARRPRSNRVVVRDFVRRRSITLRAGRSYFAFRRGG